MAPYNDATFLNRMIGNVNVATAHRDVHILFVGSKDRHSQVNAETVARTFRCGIETAQRTLKQQPSAAFDIPSTRYTGDIELII